MGNKRRGFICEPRHKPRLGQSASRRRAGAALWRAAEAEGLAHSNLTLRSQNALLAFVLLAIGSIGSLFTPK
jgi:hypothetical protein